MSGSKSNYLSKKLLEEALGGVAFASPANTYLALCTTLPDDTSTGSTIVETDYASYVRTLIGTANNQTDAWNAATGTTTAVVTNKNAITCPSATGASTNPIVGSRSSTTPLAETSSTGRRHVDRDRERATRRRSTQLRFR
jgi:hypothetical protein